MSAARRKAPGSFSAYLVTSSTAKGIEVGKILVDKGNLLVRVWELVDFNTPGSEMESAVGHRLSRVCPGCYTQKPRKVGILGHDGECRSPEVVEEALQVLRDTEKRVSAEVAS